MVAQAATGVMRGARLAPQLQQPRADQRIFHPVAGIEIPAVGGAARAAARLVVGQVGPRARIVGLLGLPGDDAALDVDLPGAGAGAVGAVRRAHDLVVLPALAIAVLPAAVLRCGDAVAVGEGLRDLVEEGQAVEKMAHGRCASLQREVDHWAGVVTGRRRAKPAARARCRSSRPPRPRVEPPGDGDAAHVEGEEAVERSLGAAGRGDRGAEALGDEEGAIGSDRRGEADDRRSSPCPTA